MVYLDSSKVIAFEGALIHYVVESNMLISQPHLGGASYSHAPNTSRALRGLITVMGMVE